MAVFFCRSGQFLLSYMLRFFVWLVFVPRSPRRVILVLQKLLLFSWTANAMKVPVKGGGKDVLKMTFVIWLAAHRDLKKPIWTFQSFIQETFHL